MTQALALLNIRLADPVRLHDVFGELAARRALSDFAVGLRSLFERLLAQHEILGQSSQDGDACWSVWFRLQAGGLPRDIDETCSSIETAGRKLAHELQTSILGTASGLRFPAELSVVALPASIAPASIPGQLAGWLDKHPRTKVAAQTCATSSAVTELEKIIGERSIRTLLQPIVSMADRRLLGYEALSRGPQESSLEYPDALFDTAHHCARTTEIELLCAELALQRTRGKLPPGSLLTVNLGPEALLLAAERLPLAGRSDVVIELTEHLPLGEADQLVAAVADLRKRGIGLALDDTGCGFADLETAKILRPEIVKLCITVIRNADRGSPFVAAIRESTEHLLALGCKVLAEGVETEEQHAALANCRIELAQGWLYGKPAELTSLFA